MNLREQNIYIVDGCRTPIGSFSGSLKSFSATSLGGEVFNQLRERNNIHSEEVGEAFLGNVCSANLGQSPARQVVLNAGLDPSIPATLVNKVCSSGLKAVGLAALSISFEKDKLILAGGMESMSNVPHYLVKSRLGFRFGHQEVKDGLVVDGLSDAYENVAMGVLADRTAIKYKVSREQQDAFAKESYEKYLSAESQGYIKNEILTLEFSDHKKNVITIARDEEPQRFNFSKAEKLKPAFMPLEEGGTVTAFNASKINDGAAGVIIAQEDKIKKLALRKQAKIIAYADYAKDPSWFTTAPIEACEKVLKIANLKISDLDAIEINEAFSVVPLVFVKELRVDPKKVNQFGGAVALGHPIGASGTRILVTLINVLKTKSLRYGMAVICNGGGGSSAIIIENLE